MTWAARVAVTMILIVADRGSASAHPGPAATATIDFRAHHDDVWVGTTFGVLASHDGGGTWEWLCESTVDYRDPFIPTYAYTESGAVFARTFRGATVMRDGCTFAPTSLEDRNVTTLALGPTGDLFVATSVPPSELTPGDAGIYRSDDDGMTFPVRADPGVPNDWWDSIRVAPSDPERVYLTGYRFSNGQRTQLLFRSDNRGASFTAMGTSGLVFTNGTIATIVGIAPTDPDTVYMKMSFQIDEIETSESLYRSVDGGATWTNLLQLPAVISVSARANGDVIAATQTEGTRILRASATDATWEVLAGAPAIYCLTENAAGELWACITGDATGVGVMKTVDALTWSPALRFADIIGPRSCPPETVQSSVCEVEEWCLLRSQLRAEANPTCCKALDGSLPPECDPQGNIAEPPDPDRCTSCASGPPVGLLAILWVLVPIAGGGVRRPRPRRREPCERRRSGRVPQSPDRG